MSKLILIFNVFFLCLVTVTSYGSEKYPFHLNVISDDYFMKTDIEKSVKKNIKKFNNIVIKNNKDFRDGVSVVLYIYGKKHDNSNLNKQFVTFSVAHTSNSDFMDLMTEVFGEESISTDRMKEITGDLIMNKKAILKYLNVASLDDLEKIDVFTETVLNALSTRINGYYADRSY